MYTHFWIDPSFLEMKILIKWQLSLWNLVNNCQLVSYIQLGPMKTAPLLNKYYWNEVILNEVEYMKSAARLLNKDYVKREGLELSKEVLWVSAGQRAAVKVGGQKRFWRSAG